MKTTKKVLRPAFKFASTQKLIKIYITRCVSQVVFIKNCNFLCPEVDIYMKILEQNKAEQKIGQM